MSRKSKKQIRNVVLEPCETDEQLHAWVRMHLGLNVPTASVCPHHDAPFEYLHHAYFEPTKDVVVWAPRGGGKTRLAAVATLLDLIHKSPCDVRILGGSFEQSLRMWEHLRPDVERVCPGLLKPRSARARRIELTNGSTAAVLTQSQRAVRGLRIQKLRCDEVEMFDEAVWQAAQLVTRSRRIVSGAIDALSTSHRIDGLMTRVIETAKQACTRVIRWCVLDVLERCPKSRDCATCPLWDECQGVAKEKCDGFFRIDDAIAMKRRVSIETWQSEMLCLKPAVHGRVFPTFDESAHVKPLPPATGESQRWLAIDFGYANPFACLWIEKREGDVTYVFDEHVQALRTIEEHVAEIRRREAEHGAVRRIACDPAGAARNEQTSASSITLLRRAGFAVKSKRSEVADGLELIRAALRPASGEPRLFIHPRCTHLIKALRAYRFKPRSEQPEKDGMHDHAIDALRYYFVNNKAGEAMRDRRY